MIAAILKRRVPGCSTWIFWVYLLLITVAELITTFVQPRSGLVLHAGILVVLIVHAAIAPSDREGNLALCLTVAPLTASFRSPYRSSFSRAFCGTRSSLYRGSCGPRWLPDTYGYHDTSSGSMAATCCHNCC